VSLAAHRFVHRDVLARFFSSSQVHIDNPALAHYQCRVKLLNRIAAKEIS
jgi:hypothetical protein